MAFDDDGNAFDCVPYEDLCSVHGLRTLRTEIDCRIEHGADSGGHLEYVRQRLDLILTPSAGDERIEQ